MSLPTFKAGIIGVGELGAALLQRLRDRDIAAIAYDVSASGQNRAASLGAEVAPDIPSLCEAAQFVSIVVRTDGECLDAALGAGGVLGKLPAGRSLLLQSTIHPDTAHKIRAALASFNVDVLDAPISGIPSTIRSGHGLAMVGATNEEFARNEGYLRLLFRDVLHLGPPGSGNVGKILKNLCTAAEGLVLIEALGLGEAAGIPYLTLLELMTKVEPFHFIENWQMLFAADGRSSTPLPVPNLFDKDVPLAKRLAEDLRYNSDLIRVLADAAFKAAAGGSI